MERNIVMLHSMPGRIRLQTSIVTETSDCNLLKDILLSFTGIQAVSIEPITQSILIYYEVEEIKVKEVLYYVHLLQSLIDNNTQTKSTSCSDIETKVISMVKFLLQFERKYTIHSYVYEYIKSTRNLIEMLVKKKRQSTS